VARIKREFIHMKQEKLDNFGQRLDEIIEHLREGRRRDAAEVINEIGDEEVRDFAFFCAEHVERGLGWLKDEVKERVTAELKMASPYNPN
jgi:hypothetical protein